MIVEIGRFALSLSLVVCLVQASVPFLGAARGDTRLMRMGGSAAQAQMGLVALAFAALVYAHVTSDFSVKNVVQNSHTLKPMLYKVTGVWGNHEGSMLLWVLILAVFGALVATLADALPERLRARTLGVQGLVSAAFLAFILFAANPFARQFPVPLEGNDLNPILQDPGLAFHPPLLYLGYVGFSIVFSFAAAALIEGRVDETFAYFVRPWVLTAWIALTLGIALGSWWAYYELGWGGFWFWDPVENASLIPWLSGTALLHSVTVLEKRGALKSWTVLLAILTFSFSLLGTFLVRSGVLTSVHAFASDPLRGLFILAILALAVGGAMVLFTLRAPGLQGGRGFAPVSRESFLLANNLLLSTAAAIVLLGTLFPLAYVALTGNTLTIGPPYFHLVFLPVAGALALLVPMGSLASWKHDAIVTIAAKLWPAVIVAALAVALAALIPRHTLAGLVWFALAGWLVAGSAIDLMRRVCFGLGGFAATRARLARVPFPVYGMLIAHVGLGITAAGIAGVSSGRQELLKAVAVGERVMLGDLSVTLESVQMANGPNYSAERGWVRIARGAETVARLTPERRFYPVQRQSTTEAAIHTSAAGDIYVVLGEAEPAAEGAPTRYALRVYINPLAPWIWIGAAIAAAGGGLSLLARRRAVLARRQTSAETVPVGAE